jgi:type IV pilus assembly protein PilE
MRGLRAHQGGFTLIELMVVVVIATILVSIATASYFDQVRQSRRTEAKTALLDLAGREESYFSTNGSIYTNTATSLGYTALPATTPNGYYTVTVACIAAQGAALGCDPNAGAPNGPAYYLTATPVAGKTQANDTQCTSFSVDSLGNQFSTGSYTAAQCWTQ